MSYSGRERESTSESTRQCADDADRYGDAVGKV